MEEHHAVAQNMQSVLTSLVFEGVFERYPTLRVVIMEGGLGWIPALRERMDKHWSRLRSEVPHLKRPPSEYIKENVWFTTQPMEEPDPAEHLRDTLGWIGLDRLLFATDYPHWDYDDPRAAMPLRLLPEEREAFFIGNARALYL